MSGIKVQRYFPKSRLLQGLVKYFWVVRSEGHEALDHKLLPVSNMDLVFNLGCPARHVAEGREEDTPQYYFRGLQSRHNTTRQSGRFNTFGVSFFPAGLYPVLGTPLADYENQTVDFDAEVPGFIATLENRIDSEGDAAEQAAILEELLLKMIDPEYLPDKNTLGLIRAFSAGGDAHSVRAFCEQHGIGQRRLERIFQKYIGASPKAFRRIQRFQTIVNRLLKRDVHEFGALAYEHGFFDQAHFINDFKALAGSSPKRFVEEKQAVMQVLQR
jgi:AraC-like DNA-binding protein